MLRNDQWCARTWNILHSTHRCLVRSEDRGYRSWCRRGCRRRSAADRRSAARRNNGTTAQPAKRSDRHQRHWRHRQCRWWMSVPVPPNAPPPWWKCDLFSGGPRTSIYFYGGKSPISPTKNMATTTEEPNKVEVVGGVVVPPRSGILERIWEVHCEKDALPLYQVPPLLPGSRSLAIYAFRASARAHRAVTRPAERRAASPGAWCSRAHHGRWQVSSLPHV
jgi:hypothetical protein